MHSGQGQLVETIVDSGGRIVCSTELVPAPGQYLLAHAAGSDLPLAVPVFFSDSAPHGFRGVFSTPPEWTPGVTLHLRGPLGRGFDIPLSARRVALIAFDDSPARLRGLVPLLLKTGAAVTLVCSHAPDDLAEDVEIQPLRAIEEIYEWADYVAIDVARENLSELRHRLNEAGQARVRSEAQVLIRTAMPCGAMAECGVCAVTRKDSWTMVCRDGPVFRLSELA